MATDFFFRDTKGRKMAASFSLEVWLWAGFLTANSFLTVNSQLVAEDYRMETHTKYYCLYIAQVFSVSPISWL